MTFAEVAAQQRSLPLPQTTGPRIPSPRPHERGSLRLDLLVTRLSTISGRPRVRAGAEGDRRAQGAPRAAPEGDPARGAEVHRAPPPTSPRVPGRVRGTATGPSGSARRWRGSDARREVTESSNRKLTTMHTRTDGHPLCGVFVGKGEAYRKAVQMVEADPLYKAAPKLREILQRIAGQPDHAVGMRDIDTVRRGRQGDTRPPRHAPEGGVVTLAEVAIEIRRVFKTRGLTGENLTETPSASSVPSRPTPSSSCPSGSNHWSRSGGTTRRI